MAVANEKAETKKDRGLNKAQKACVENNLDKSLVIAGPGTGKTHTVSEKIKYLVEQEQINPEKILCLTFSETAAREMKERAGENYPINVFTFHGFCLNIIQNHEDEFDFQNIEIITDSNKRAIINECIQEIHSVKPLEGYNDEKNNPYGFSKAILDGIGEIKKNRVSKEQFFKNLETNPLWIHRLKNIPNIIEEKRVILAQKEEELEKLQQEHAKLKSGKKTDFKKSYITPLKNEITKIKEAIEDKLPKQQINCKKSVQQMRELWSLYELYEKKKASAGFIDYHDMINAVLEKFDDKNSSLLKEVTSLYDFVLVDEYQDTNTAQNEIVFKLGENCPHLFVVGDDDQIIYSFQGAHLDTIEKLIKKFNLGKENINCLTENYRSTEAILKAAHAMAELQDEFAFYKSGKRSDITYAEKYIPLRLSSKPNFKELGIDKELNPANKNLYENNNGINFIKFQTSEDEIHSIVNRISEIINPENDKYKTPEKLSEIAVLTTTNKELEDYATYLKAKGISVEFTNGRNIFKINSVMALITYMQFLISPEEYSDKMFAYLLMYPFHINPADYYTLKTGCKTNNKSLIERINDILYKTDTIEEMKGKIYNALKSNKDTVIDDIKKLIQNDDYKKADKTIFVEPDKIKEFVETYDYLKRYVVSENYKNAILEIGTKTGIFKYYFDEEINRAENIKGINTLINEADSYFAVHTDREKSFVQFVEYITNLINTESEITTSKDDKPSNAVQLSTYHSAKGREFEYVFMPNLKRAKWKYKNNSESNQVKETIPSAPSPDDTYESLTEKLEQEEFLNFIKLLYVGITRAKHSLSLSASSRFSWFIEQFEAKLKNHKLSNGKDILNVEDGVKFTEADYKEPGTNYDYKQFEIEAIKNAIPKKYSPTALNTYLTCPRQYFFKYILKWEDKTKNTKNNDNNDFGTAVHNTFQRIIEYAQAEKKYPKTIKEVMCIFEEEMQNFTFEHYDEVKERGRTLFENYYEKFKTLANPEITTFETEKSISLEIEDETLKNAISFSGKFDRIDTDKDGNTTIYDYKTGIKKADKIKEIKNGKNIKYYNQMALYKYILQQNGYKVTKVCFICPELQDEKQEKEIYVDKLNDEECEKIFKQCIDIVHRIHDFKFDKKVEIGQEPKKNKSGEKTHKEYKKPDCKYCNYPMWCKEQKIF